MLLCGGLGQHLGQLLALLFTCCSARASRQIRYSVPEELEHGAFVGNIAEDLGLDMSDLSPRRFRVVSGTNKQHLEVNLENGILFINEKIDREEVCEAQPVCRVQVQALLENPLQLYRVEVEVLDINDNAPSFPWQDYVLEVSESATPGSRFPLESAQDPDVGSNCLRSYKLSPNGFFSLQVQSRSDGSKFAELVLERPLDREQQNSHRLLLTAMDGGRPERSGSAVVTVSVLDANDNVPSFQQSLYRVSLEENVPLGTLVIQLNATDLDEGTNGEIEYSLSGHAAQKVRELFLVEPRTGHVRVKGLLDYEKCNVYEVYIQAKDRGPSAVSVHCRLLVSLLDVNDNSPEIVLTSVSSPVMEDASPGTVIAVISVTDRDSGDNGELDCRIAHNVPFELHSSYKNYFTLVTTERLDREQVPEYNISISATDSGSPALTTNKVIHVRVNDVNDNSPAFPQPSYTVYVPENNPPGASICSVTASDPDYSHNAFLSYSIAEGEIQGMPVATYVSINSDTGSIYALRSFDFEQIRNFQIRVQAQDAGFPPLSSNVTVHVFILDHNDNAPVIVSPLPKNGTLATDLIPRDADPGYLIGKITAMDADSGQNSRLSYQIIQVTDSTLFSISLYSGELRTIRVITERDATKHRLLIQIRDNGQPALSTSLSLLLTVVDNIPDSHSEFNDVPLNPDPATSSLTLYLIVSLGSVSFTFLVAIIVLTVIKCRKDRLSLQDYKCSLPTCCCMTSDSSGGVFKNSNINLQISSGNKVQTNCMETTPPNYCYKVCLTPESAKSDFMFLKPYNSTTQNNEKVPEKVAPGRTGHAVNKAVNEIKLPNTDWSPQKEQKPSLKSSQSLEDLGTRKGSKKDHDRLRTLVSPVTDIKKKTTTSNEVWSPKYGLQFQQQGPSLDYQHNVYIPGTPTLLANKQGLLEEKNSFSTFGKKRRMSCYGEVRDDMMINNDLK
ncbi:protocadherin-10 [Xenopus laevis]|uniref:Protocadherin-10 n=2 Tax=Xenopus laevis TaxID=8355 RepID=A0A1L8GVP6_XENLA|nr:protocadherin-10 [Xenopus laevis]OCT87899.1 hypothetical protein XELAEV_18021603mg [Xenopus laevis]